MSPYTQRAKIFLSSFNSEKYWENSSFTKLPRVINKQSDRIVAVMDELQWVFTTNSDDIVLTRLSFDENLKEYLQLLGISFKSVKVFDDGISFENESHLFSSINEVILNNLDYVKSQINNPYKYEISTYAVDNYSSEAAERLFLNHSFPSFETTSEINSKVYSHHLSKILFENTEGQVVYSADELQNSGDDFLKKGSFLIKDPFGVSGNGNILILNTNSLTVIVNYIKKQEKKGKSTIFLIEPFYEKAIDFSSQVYIDKRKNYKLLSIQKMNNENFKFRGIQKAPGSLLKILEKKKYYNSIEVIINEIIKQGYYGNLCIDSMLLKNGNLIPCIEINGRKSMGYINYCLNKRFNQLNCNSQLITYSLGVPNNITFFDFFDFLKTSQLLFTTNSQHGIIPLTARTLGINKDFTDGLYHAKLYLYFCYSSDMEFYIYCKKLNELFKELNMIQYE